MRPPVSDIVSPHPRKSSFEQLQQQQQQQPQQSIGPSSWATTADTHSAAPATFFLTRDNGVSGDDSPPSCSSPDDPAKDSMYGVQSLNETLQQASLTEDSFLDHRPVSPDCPPSPLRDLDDDDLVRRRPMSRFLDRLDIKRDACSASPSFSLRYPLSETASPRPLTPFNVSNFDDHDPSSLPSSPKSFSNQSVKPLDDISIADDLSNPVGSGEEDNELPGASVAAGSDSTSQLVMPSIKMPSRRPFTEQGKAMGRFKVLIAGAPGKGLYSLFSSISIPTNMLTYISLSTGSGKTSLVSSIVQACEDIVHADPFPSAATPWSRRRRSVHSAVSEIYASTKPYPSWWPELDDSRLRRRKSSGDVVLERNLCFVDTPDIGLGPVEQTAVVIQYIQQQQLRNAAALNTVNADFQNLIAGNGGSQVDALLYLISEGRFSPASHYIFSFFIICSLHDCRYSCDRYRVHPETWRIHKCHSPCIQGRPPILERDCFFETFFPLENPR